MEVIDDILALGVVKDMDLEAVAPAKIFDEQIVLFAFDDIDKSAYSFPITISTELAQRHNLSIGDTIDITYYQPILFREGNWFTEAATIVDVHDGEALPQMFTDAIIIPLPKMKEMFGYFTGFISSRFTIDPAFNHDLIELTEQIDFYARHRYPWREPLAADIWDQELRFGVAVYEQHIGLLRLLLPVASVISILMGAGLAMLVMLQSSKSAATMRVLGMPLTKTRVVLWCQQMIISTFGALIGFLVAGITLPYLTGAIIGSAAGAMLITNKSPLGLLQVKE